MEKERDKVIEEERQLGEKEERKRKEGERG